MELKRDFFFTKIQQNTEFGVSQVEFPSFLFRNRVTSLRKVWLRIEVSVPLPRKKFEEIFCSPRKNKTLQSEKNTSTLLVNDVIPRVYKKQHCNIRSPLMKTLDWSVETLGRECKSIGRCILLNKTRVANEI